MSDLRTYSPEEAIRDCADARLTRRRVLKVIAGIAGGALAAKIPSADAQQSATQAVSPYHVPADDPQIIASWEKFDSDGALIEAYLARPAKTGRFPLVLVCHEDHGVTAHTEDVARRVARNGYVTLAVDMVSREGGSDKVAYSRIPELLKIAPPSRHVQDFQSGLRFAKSHSFVRTDRVGMVGFGFGGGVTWRVATAMPELRAAVSFYGLPVPAVDAPKIHAAILAICAGSDNRVNQYLPALEAAMRQHRKTFRKIVYPSVDAAFYNDTGAHYDAGAAEAAWKETLAWLKKYLQA